MAEPVEYASFHSAYLVATGNGSNFVGVVRKEGPGWRVLLFGVPDAQQPTDRFVTRKEAADRLIQLSG